MELIFKKEDPVKFASLWQDYINENNVSFQYPLSLLEMSMIYSDNILFDESFVACSNDKCEGICFIPIESINNNNSISILNSYVLRPVAKTKKIEKKIYAILDKLCLTHNINKVKFSYDNFSNSKFNNLLKYNFIDTSTMICGIDLTLNEKKLWSNLNKSYKSLINNLTNDNKFEIIISDDHNISMLHNWYVKFHSDHLKRAGKSTLNSRIYSKYFELYKSGLTSIIAVLYNKEVVMVNYFVHDNELVGYSNSVYRVKEEYKKYPLNHFLLWNAILYFRSIGYTTLNFGSPCGYGEVSGLGDYLDKKQINISSFKRGMGASVSALYRGVGVYGGSNLDNIRQKIKDINV